MAVRVHASAPHPLPSGRTCYPGDAMAIEKIARPVGHASSDATETVSRQDTRDVFKM
jgi:hypothetical protein